ncbi:Vitamin B12 import system permease protein BtuC [Streptomyces microflavus]
MSALTRTAVVRGRALGGLSLRIRPRPLAVTLLLALLAAGSGALALTRDGLVPPAEVLGALFGAGSEQAAFVVLELRLPRVALGLVVGAALGAAGALFQQLSRNPLGSPDIVGFNSGAATGALLVLLHGDPAYVAAGAAGGGLATAVIVQLLARRGSFRGNRLILAGIAVGSLLASVNAYLLTRAALDHAQSAQLWLIGSLGSTERHQHGVQVVDQARRVVGRVAGEQPGVAVRVPAELHRDAAALRVRVEQLPYVLLEAGETAALHPGEADRAQAGRGETGGGLEGEGGRGDGEELVEVGADGFAAAEDGVEQAHGRNSFGSLSGTGRWRCATAGPGAAPASGARRTAGPGTPSRRTRA